MLRPQLPLATPSHRLLRALLLRPSPQAEERRGVGAGVHGSRVEAASPASHFPSSGRPAKASESPRGCLANFNRPKLRAENCHRRAIGQTARQSPVRAANGRRGGTQQSSPPDRQSLRLRARMCQFTLTCLPEPITGRCATFLSNATKSSLGGGRCVNDASRGW